MPTYIEMPSLSDTMTEGTLLKWKIQPGDKVAAGQVIAEIQTDKATMEMEAFNEGVVHKLYINEGDKVPLGAPMAIILSEGEQPPADDAAPAKQPAPASSPSDKAESSEAARPPRPELPARFSGQRRMGAGVSRSGRDRVKASPLARKIASERGVTMAAVQGTGPGGRIVKADVLAAAANASAARSSVAVIRPSPGPNDSREPLSQTRQIIAQRLIASKTQIPHFYLNIEIDAGPLMAFRAQANAAEEQKSSGNKFTVNDFILKAVAMAATQVPAVNAAFDIDAIVRFAQVNLNVAIAVDDGLVTPVIREAEKKSLTEISAAVKDLAGRAKNRKLRPEEFQSGTITVSNLGAYGIDSFDAIINPPQAVIVSIGAVSKKPSVDASGQLAVGERMWVGMSCDHRVVDGAIGAQYLQALRKLLENPALMLL